jgi:hypothetical protein
VKAQPCYLTSASKHYLVAGDVVVTNGESWVVQRIVDSHTVVIRRTFWAWLRKMWARLVAWWRS